MYLCLDHEGCQDSRHTQFSLYLFVSVKIHGHVQCKIQLCYLYKGQRAHRTFWSLERYQTNFCLGQGRTSWHQPLMIGLFVQWESRLGNQPVSPIVSLPSIAHFPFHITILTSVPLKRIVTCICHCAFIINFLANSFFILQIHHAKSFKMRHITYLYFSYLSKYS